MPQLALGEKLYGLWLDQDVSPTEFRDWAWSDENIGWISFNCTDRGICSTSNYKVVIGLSLVRGPDVPGNLSETWNDCTSFKELSMPTFKWNYSHPDDIPQHGYQIKIYGENELDLISEIASDSYAPEMFWVRENLLFGEKTYSWQVRVKDENDNWSDWSEIKEFQTREHAYPWIDFSWAQERPSVNEIVQFTDQSETYGGADKQSWEWIFPDANPSYSNLENPTTTFSFVGVESVSLKVTDSSGFYCPKSQDITISLPLPEYKEVAPISLLNLPRNYLNQIEAVLNKQSERLSAEIFSKAQELFFKLFD